MVQPNVESIQQYWLVKSEPQVFGIADLAKCKKQTTYWDGVRNYQARNILRDQMKVGDSVFFYHSSIDAPAIVGLTKVVRSGYFDHTAFEKANEHFDPKSKPDQPRWYMVDLKLVSVFKEPLSLSSLRKIPELSSMVLLQRGSRLSVQPVRESEFQVIMSLIAKSR